MKNANKMQKKIQKYRTNDLMTHFNIFHCMKSVCICRFSGSYFPAFGLNTERCGVSPLIQSECGKIRTRKTPNTDTFHAVFATVERRKDNHAISKQSNKINWQIKHLIGLR